MHSWQGNTVFIICTPNNSQNKSQNQCKHQHQPLNLMCTGNQTQRKLIHLWCAEHILEELTVCAHLSCVQFKENMHIPDKRCES